MLRDNGDINPAHFASTKQPILQASMPPPHFFPSGAVSHGDLNTIFFKE